MAKSPPGIRRADHHVDPCRPGEKKDTELCMAGAKAGLKGSIPFRGGRTRRTPGNDQAAFLHGRRGSPPNSQGFFCLLRLDPPRHHPAPRGGRFSRGVGRRGRIYGRALAGAFLVLGGGVSAAIQRRVPPIPGACRVCCGSSAIRTPRPPRAGGQNRPERRQARPVVVGFLPALGRWPLRRQLDKRGPATPHEPSAPSPISPP